MRKVFALSLAFCLGFWTRSTVSAARAENPKRVTGIGGIFFKSPNPGVLKDWYSRHLGLKMNENGHLFEWKTLDSKPAITQWSVFGKESKYFEPSTSSFMLNYQVVDLEALIPVLKSEGVTVVDKMETYSYGNFVHIMDPDGNKV